MSPLSTHSTFVNYLETHLVEAIRIEQTEYQQYRPALDAVSNTGFPRVDRTKAVRGFLRYFAVFQGIGGQAREDISACVVDWADKQGDLTLAADRVAVAHLELTTAIQRAYGKKRRFTSLASKAMWLKYPEDAPIFDKNAQIALQVLSRLDPVTDPISYPPTDDNEYLKFLPYWQYFYEFSKTAIEAKLWQYDPSGQLHAVKVFDRVLWSLGNPRFGD